FSADDPRWGKPVGKGDNTGPSLARLPASGEEVRRLAQLLNVDDAWVWTDAQASEKHIKVASQNGDLARARYVHFATHGVLELGSGRGPALVLTRVGTTGESDPLGGVDDGYLMLSEVAALRLNADLVVL